MKKKKLKKMIRALESKVAWLVLTIQAHQECCEGYKPRGMTFKEWKPLPSIKDYFERGEQDECATGSESCGSEDHRTGEDSCIE